MLVERFGFGSIKSPQLRDSSSAVGRIIETLALVGSYRRYRKSHTSGEERPVRLHYSRLLVPAILCIF